MRARFFLLIVLAVAIFVAPAVALQGEGEKPESLNVTKAPPRALKYHFVPEKSSIAFEVATTFSLIRGQALHWKGNVHVDAEAPPTLRSRIVIAADSLDSRSRARDKAIRDVVLEAAKYPEIVFSAGSYQGDLSKLAPGTIMTIEVSGELTVHGVTQPIQTPIQCAVLEDHIFIAGAVPIRWKAFGVRDMSKIFSKVKDPMTVIFRLWAVPDE